MFEQILVHKAEGIGEKSGEKSQSKLTGKRNGKGRRKIGNRSPWAILYVVEREARMDDLMPSILYPRCLAICGGK